MGHLLDQDHNKPHQPLKLHHSRDSIGYGTPSTPTTRASVPPFAFDGTGSTLALGATTETRPGCYVGQRMEELEWGQQSLLLFLLLLQMCLPMHLLAQR